MKIKEKFINLIEKIINKNKENAEQKQIKMVILLEIMMMQKDI